MFRFVKNVVSASVIVIIDVSRILLNGSYVFL